MPLLVSVFSTLLEVHRVLESHHWLNACSSLIKFRGYQPTFSHSTTPGPSRSSTQLTRIRWMHRLLSEFMYPHIEQAAEVCAEETSGSSSRDLNCLRPILHG